MILKDDEEIEEISLDKYPSPHVQSTTNETVQLDDISQKLDVIIQSINTKLRQQKQMFTNKLLRLINFFNAELDRKTTAKKD